MKPAARRDGVGDVGELVGTVDGDEVSENGGLDEIGVQFGYPVDLVRTHDCEESHANHLRLRFFDDGNPPEHVAVLGELLLHGLEEEQVDVIDNLHVTWKEVLQERNRPLLQGLRKDSVVGVAKLEMGERVSRKGPSVDK